MLAELHSADPIVIENVGGLFGPTLLVAANAVDATPTTSATVTTDGVDTLQVEAGSGSVRGGVPDGAVMKTSRESDC